MTPRVSRVPKIQCPHCGGWFSKVVDPRSVPTGYQRRRQCLSCSRRYTTTEVVVGRYSKDA